MYKSKLEQVVEDMKNLDTAFRKFNSTVSSGPASFYFEEIMGYYEGCMKAAKFQEGDRVTLKEDWTGGASGWQHCKHFLKEGSPATVKSIDYHKGKYRYEIEFDNETWMDDKGVEKPTSHKHLFTFGQKELKRLRNE
jgi:hypothetical protein